MKSLSIRAAVIGVCALVVLPFAIGQNPNLHGITVGEIKIYDEKSLEDLLNSAYKNLGAINAFDPGVTKQLGMAQGATSNQTGVSVTGGTAAPPTQSSPPALTLPTSSALSAGNFLNEETQLGLQIINTQLLLHGALNDQAAADKSRVTIGLPISIAVPPGSKYQEAVADVQISVCGYDAKPISLALLLPQEKTYNVASLVSKVGNIGGAGTIAGVVNLGASILHGHQSYFLVQDQDTLAMQRPEDSTGCDAGTHAVTFAWQFRPVLGQKVVRDGMRQTFAQLSVPNGISGSPPAALKTRVLTSWRRYDARTGRVGGRIDQPASPSRPIALFSRPVPYDVSVQDNGDGNLTVLAQGSYWPGTRVRIGATVQDASSSNFEQNDHDIRFVASALSLAVAGASTVNGDGTEWPVVPPRLSPSFLGAVNAPPLTLSVKSGNADQTLTTEFRGIKDELKSPPDVDCKDQNGASCPGLDTKQVALAGLGHVVRLTFNISAAAPGTWTFTLTSSAETLGNANFVVNPVTVKPFNDGSSLVRVQLAASLAYDSANPDVIVIGNKAFGLRDAPYYERTPDHATALVSNDLLATYRSLTWQRFLDPPPVRVANGENLAYPIPFFPASAAGASEFSITSITPITAAASSGDSPKGGAGSAPAATAAGPTLIDVGVGMANGTTITGKGLLAIGDGTPALVGFSPSSGQRGETVTGVMITGAFTAFMTDKPTLTSSDGNVKFLTDSDSYVDDTHLKATAVIGEKAIPGPVTISTISGAAGAKAASGIFTVGSAQRTVTEVEPKSASTDTMITITGDAKTKFSSGSVVWFSDPSISAGKVNFDKLKPKELRVPITVKSDASGRSDVIVITGSETAIGTGKFTANPDKPSVLRIDPAGVRQGQTTGVTIYTSGADLADPPTLTFTPPGIGATKPPSIDPAHKDQIQATLIVPPATPQKASNRFAISGVRLSSLRFVEPVIEPDFVSDTLVTFGLTDDQVKQYKNLVMEYGAGQRLLQPLSPTPPPAPPARSLTAQPAAGIPATQTSVPIAGTGMSQVVAIRYNDQALPFNVASDTKLTLQLVAPQTGKAVLAAPGIVVVVEYLDKSLVPYSIPVAAASK